MKHLLLTIFLSQTWKSSRALSKATTIQNMWRKKRHTLPFSTSPGACLSQKNRLCLRRCLSVKRSNVCLSIFQRRFNKKQTLLKTLEIASSQLAGRWGYLLVCSAWGINLLKWQIPFMFPFLRYPNV